MRNWKDRNLNISINSKENLKFLEPILPGQFDALLGGHFTAVFQVALALLTDEFDLEALGQLDESDHVLRWKYFLNFEKFNFYEFLYFFFDFLNFFDFLSLIFTNFI